MNNNKESPPVDPGTSSGRLLLLEWRMSRIEDTLKNFTRAMWTVAATVIGALVVFYLTSKGAR